jgi:hypothetical protein
MRDEDAHGGWRLLVAFPDQSPSFAHGVEAGKIWMRLKTEAGTIECVTMVENAEVLRRLAEYQGWRVEHTLSEVAGWNQTTFTRVRLAGKIVNPHGLRSV